MRIVLTINAGSSSVRFAFYDVDAGGSPLVAGKIERIGLPGTLMTVDDARAASAGRTETRISADDHRSASAVLLDWMASHALFERVAAVGHRIVHGMQHADPERVTPDLLAELRAIVPFDPEHLPREIELIESVAARHPDLPQVACFDTAFHRSMPRVATLLALPRRYAARGMQRYGFHGLSYTYLMSELRRLGDPAASRGRVVLAHLGNGASLAAVLDGKSVDTSMGFTPASGVVMSTRSGDLDPGIVSFLAATDGMDAAAFQTMVTQHSGLLGVSETASDVRDLLAREAGDVRAAEALALFCYQIKKWIGAYAAVLGGLDTLVFAGGIGENAAPIRWRICDGLGFLGVELDAQRNSNNAALISADGSAASVRVIRTNEESVIASSTMQALAWKS